jgi:hypothetical protein
MARYASDPSMPSGPMLGSGMGLGRMGSMSGVFPFNSGLNIGRAFSMAQAKPNPATQLQPSPGALATPEGIQQAAQSKGWRVDSTGCPPSPAQTARRSFS